MDIDGNKVVYFGSGGSSDLGPAAERELLNWIEELCRMGYPPEWGSVHTAAQKALQELKASAYKLCALICF